MKRIVLLVTILLFQIGCITTSEHRETVYIDSEFKVEVTVFKSKTPAQKSLIIMPPTGGPNYIDRSYAQEFQRKGFDVYLVNRWTGDSESRVDLDIHQVLYTRAQKAIALTLRQIKTPYIGMLGTSIGGLHASISASIQDQLNAILVITAGAPITEVIVNSDQKAMRDVKKKRYEKYGFKNDSEYLNALQKEFHLEPMQLGEGFKNKKLGMVIGEKDTTVSNESQRRLQKYWNPKTSIVFENNHFWSIVKTWLFESDTVFKFFESEN